jgi:hypothetical protein
MATPLDVARRTTKASDEKVSQALLGTLQIFRRVHRAEHIISRHLCIKRADEPLEAFFANARIDLFLTQIHNSSMTDEAPKTAYELAMERLRQKDAEAGVEERQVSDEQKAQIAEIKRVYAAKIAEAEIFHRSKLLTLFDPQERALLDEGHRRDLERLREEQEQKLEKVRR